MKLANIVTSMALFVATTSHSGALEFPLHGYVISVESPYDHETHYLLRS